MSRSKKVPASGVEGKLSNVAHPAPAVLPPDGWVKRSPFGFLGYADVDLARLGDVLLWMDHVKGWSRARSVSELVKAMPEDVMGCLYCIRRNDEFQGVDDDADLMPPDSEFSTVSPGSWPCPAWRTEDEHRQWLALHRRPQSDPPRATGRAALVERLPKWARARVTGPDQPDPVNDTKSRFSMLAVPMAKAYQWWGYGRQAAPAGADTETGGMQDVSTWAGLVAQRWSEPGADWTDDMLVTIAEEEGRRKDAGEREVRDRMGAQLPNPKTPADKGITANAVGKLVRRGLKVIQERDKAAKEKENAATSRNRSVFDLASAPAVTPKKKG